MEMNFNENLFVNRSLFIHAWQFKNENLLTLDVFIQESSCRGYKILNDVLYLHLQTNENEIHTFTAMPGEYLVKDPTGWIEVYPEDNLNQYWVKFSTFIFVEKKAVLN